MTNYGWVQNTSNLSTIRDTLELVPENGIKHIELREAIRAFREKHGALPNKWEWDARCRIKAIHAVGLVKIDRAIRGYELTDLGRELKNCQRGQGNKGRRRGLSQDELNIFKKGLLTNPPVVRILRLLNEDRKHSDTGLSKYDIGRQLGFVGDIGFTHIAPHWVAQQGYSFNDKEGDADKWARTILSWLCQVRWVVEAGYHTINGKKLRLYRAIPEVDRILRYGANSIKRNVPSEMLCSNHHPFPKLVQKRRVIILRELSKQHLTTRELKRKLESEGIEASEMVCQFEVVNLINAGFTITESGGYYKLKDKIELDIEELGQPDGRVEDRVEDMIEELVVRYERTIPGRLIDHLVRYGYNDAKAVEFEAVVAEYFRFLGYDADYLGQGRGRVPDILVKWKHPNIYANSYGLIVDAKATRKMYSFPASDKRKMKEYIAKYGPSLLEEKIPNHAFSFVSSGFTNNVIPHLKEISKATNIGGCAIAVGVLLEFGDKVVKGQLKVGEMYNMFNLNDLFVVN